MKKNRRVSIRLTESQMMRLTDTLIEEQITKSQLIREMINKYVRFSRRTDKSNVLQKINEIRDINNEIQ
jgi:DNA-binding transcriptional regulator YbjK